MAIIKGRGREARHAERPGKISNRDAQKWPARAH
jgi:hypothetical protein